MRIVNVQNYLYTHVLGTQSIGCYKSLQSRAWKWK